MADLKVEYGALEAAERGLSRIVLDLEASEFYRDDLERAWGSRKVADAMRDFVDNWDRHRRDLLDDITTVGTMCGETCSTFRAIERALNAVATDGRGPT